MHVSRFNFVSQTQRTIKILNYKENELLEKICRRSVR